MASTEPLPPMSPGLAGPAAALTRRRLIVVLLMAIAAISHFNRISISTAGNARIMAQYGIAPEIMGWVYSAFLITYTAFMIPGGWVIDRFGAKKALLGVGLGSALFVALTGTVGLLARDASVAFVALLLIRGLMGIVSAPLHPSMARMVGNWVPPGGRAHANGLVTGAALVGIAATPVVFGFLIDQLDWPSAFLVAAGTTALIALVWAVLAGDHPARPVETKLSLTTPLADPDLDPEPPPPAWIDLLTDRSLVLLTISYAAVGYFQYLFFYWMNYYFDKILALPESRSRVYQAIPLLAMAVGMGLGGWASDLLEHRFGPRRGRRIVPMAGLAGGAVLLGLGVLAREPAWIVLWFALAMGAVGASEGPFWSSAIELGGRRGGSSGALFNTGGNAGGILAPIITPLVGQHYGWPSAVALGGLVCIAGVLLWLGIDVDRKLKS